MNFRFRTFRATSPSFTPGSAGSPPPPAESRTTKGSSILSPATAPLINAICGLLLFLLVAVAILKGGMEVTLALGIGAGLATLLFYFIGYQIVQILLREASEILFAPYGVHDGELARQLLYDYIVHHYAPVMLVTNGEIDPRSIDSPLTKMGKRGPGFVRVDEVSAVLVEYKTKAPAASTSPGVIVTMTTMRVLTLGQHFLDKHDTIRGIVDLRLAEKLLDLENVITKDGIPLKIGLRLYFRIFQDQNFLLRSGRYQTNQDSIRKAILSTNDWKLQTIVSAESKIRDHFARFNFNAIQGSYPRAVRLETSEIYEPITPVDTEDSPRATIQYELVQELNNVVTQWGAEIIALAVDKITIPEEVEKTLRLAWAAGWNNKIAFEKADTNARVQKRTSEGNRDAAEINRNAKLITEQGDAEAERISAQIESERERLLAEAHAAAERVKESAHTEVHLNSVQMVLNVLKENNISLESELASKIFDTMRQKPNSGHWRKNKDGSSVFEEWPPEKPDNGARDN